MERGGVVMQGGKRKKIFDSVVVDNCQIRNDCVDICSCGFPPLLVNTECGTSGDCCLDPIPTWGICADD
jgi:hypothetical protein